MISVVIPAYNERANIGRCLAALAAQRVEEPMEVVLVDNNSTDGTAEEAMAQAQRLGLELRVLHEGVQRRGAARATGCRAARGQILLNTDADAEPPPEWAAKMAEALRRPGVAGATGTGRIIDCDPVTNRLYNTLMPFFAHLGRIFTGNYPATGYTVGATRAAYDAVGGFGAENDACEDLELGFRLAKLGKVVLVADAPVLVSGRRFRRGFVRGIWGYIWTFLQKYLLRRSTAYLDNPRDTSGPA